MGSLNDERGVAPVVAVILMVAVTVVLAAIIGGFVIGTGDETQTTPSVKLAFDYNSTGYLTVRHAGGQKLDSKNTFQIEIAYTTQSGADATETWSLPVTASDAKTLADPPKEGTKVEVIWTGPEGEESVILESDVVP